ncbi:MULTISPECIES: alpha/beta hydrolase [unclassified Novosphingobium]|uniref:alpha/beta hydrolase n=1 Tax=unclassified Novosphingobium TaxID=2644732 RepID=UPI000D300A1A|nr:MULTISPECIES: alpha/beta hydrolase [unclassified Novosphingobium]PTR07687.1 acetyl esterase/lipase [Novosphingobium sp. GV055]PUB00373.1 acetyl esterase/lipase [Novosphingobium sp. GV061]PUB15712.1 acetyl esterase/lipase [Novosphingobium sp. GV079]PUB39399.1 acetyl esterase/lipase [Novosphingobium sp. GV027]
MALEITRRSLAQWAGSLAVSQLVPPIARAAAGSATGGALTPGDALRYVNPALRPSAEMVARMSAEHGTPNDSTLAELRRPHPEFMPKRLPDVAVEERLIPVPGGAPAVKVFVINARAGSKRPAIVHMHGGGYIAGTAAFEVGKHQAVAKELDCVIVTVDYRLAPETRFTGSVEDNYAALKWVHDNAATLGVDPNRIAIMGESAGGGHAARLAITARDRGEVPVLLQVLIYPMLDDRTGSTVIPPFPLGSIGWDAPSNRYGWSSFLGMRPGGANVPAAGVPARVKDLGGLAPAFIGVGGIDLFVSEDVAYARRLIEAKVPCELLVIPGAYHGFDVVAADTAPARQFTKAKFDALRRAFGNSDV